VDDRFLIIKVTYDRHPECAQSLESIAPELKDAGLSLIEDHTDGPSPSRTWAGIVHAPMFERFADAWQLHDETNEPTLGNADRHPTMRAQTLDGMNWEPDGGSPIAYVTLHVAGDWDEARRHPPFTHPG
jgi:hypothetical protein